MQTLLMVTLLKLCKYLFTISYLNPEWILIVLEMPEILIQSFSYTYWLIYKF